MLNIAHACCPLTLQIQRNLAAAGNIEEMQKVAIVPDRKAKVGASLGYIVRTLLQALGLEVCHFCQLESQYKLSFLHSPAMHDNAIQRALKLSWHLQSANMLCCVYNL